MIQRLVSVVVGAIVTFLLLLLFDAGDRIVNDEFTGYLVAVVVGALVTLFWPFLWSQSAARRARARYDESVRQEVQRQVEAQRTPQEEPDTQV